LIIDAARPNPPESNGLAPMADPAAVKAAIMITENKILITVFIVLRN
jgi:hypothetical protein